MLATLTADGSRAGADSVDGVPTGRASAEIAKPPAGQRPVIGDRSGVPERGDRVPPDVTDHLVRRSPDGAAQRTPDRSAQGVLDRPVRYAPDLPGQLAPDRPAQSFPDRPAQSFPDRPAQSFPDRPAIPAHSMPNRSPLELLILARQGLAEAAEESHDGPRYATAHLAALRAAAAVLAIRARPVTGHRSQITNVWSLLIQVAPELREWAEFFAATARKRTMAQAGVAQVVSAREADDLLRDADHFVGVVTDLIGLR